MHTRTSQRRGSVLALTFSALVVAGTFATFLMYRSVGASRTAGAGRDHLAIRMLAESACEELFHGVQLGANAPGDPVFEALRAPAGTGQPVPLPGVVPASLAGELRDLGRQLGAELRLASAVSIDRREGISADPMESRGTIMLEASVTLARRPRPVVERVRVRRGFHVAHTGLPPSLGRAAMIVLGTTRDAVLRLPAGRPMSSGSAAQASLFQLLTDRPPAGLTFLPAAAGAPLAAAAEGFSTLGLARRAHFLTTTRAQLERFVNGQLQAGKPLNGVLMNLSSEPMEIAITSPFRGQATIAAAGPMLVGDVTLEDPARDSLTFVSPAGIVVAGSRVEANLVSTGGVRFSRRADVEGRVVSVLFPRAQGLGARDLEACRVGRPDGGAGAAGYFAAFSPHSIGTEHRRDTEDWSAW